MPEASSNAKPPQVYTSAHFAIELDDLPKRGALPTLRTVDGGGVKADVVSYQMGENGDIWRQLGKPKYDDIKMTLGLADAEPLFDWFRKFWKGEHLRKNGAIIAADANYRERARREFSEAFLVEFGVPKWDATDKNQVNITLALAPEKVVFKPGQDAGPVINERSSTESSQKQITACNFDFTIDGYGEACKRVAKVDAFSIKLKMIEHHYGTRLEAAKVPGKIEYPNLVFYVPEADAELFRAAHNERMAGIRKDQGKGVGAQLTFFNNGRVNKGQFEFKGVHIFNVSPEKADASSEDMKLTKVECAVEYIDFKLLDQ